MSTKTENNVSVQQMIKWCITLLVPVGILLLVPTTDVITVEIKRYLAITIGTVLIWIFELLPTFVSGIIMVILYILTKVAGAGVVLSPWTNQIVWLCFGGMFIGVAFTKTGLMKRIAFWMIRLTGYSYRGIIIGLILSGVVVNVLLPNNVARITLYSTLAFGLCNALKLKAHSKSAAGIMLASFLASMAGRFLVYSGNDDTVLAMGYIEETVSFKDHLFANAPWTIVWVALMIALILLVFKSDTSFESKEYFDEEFKKMGGIKSQELKFLVMLVVTIGLMIWSGIEIGWLFMLVACICFLPGINILEAEDMKDINFGMAIFIACAMAIGNVATELGIGTLIGNWFISAMEGTVISKFVFYPLVWLFGAAVNLLMTPVAAIAGFTVPLVSIANAMGMSSVGTVYSLVWGVEQVIFAYEWVPCLIVFGYGMINNKQFTIFGILRMVLSLLVLVGIIIPLWSMVGFI